MANETLNQENDTARLDERNRAEMIMYVGAHGTTTETEPETETETEPELKIEPHTPSPEPEPRRAG